MDMWKNMFDCGKYYESGGGEANYVTQLLATARLTTRGRIAGVSGAGGGVGESVGGRREGSDPGNWGGTRAASCGLTCYTWLSPVGSWTARCGFVDDAAGELEDDL